MKFVGVDACPAGWFAVVLSGGPPKPACYETIERLWNEHADADRLLVDIPIGLHETERRRCDELAKERLGCRRASVFYTPSRSVLGIDDDGYDRANALNRDRTGHGLSRQTWNIVPKIREVDELLERNADADGIVRESHPELCFYAFNGRQPIAHSKRSDTGLKKRREVLRTVLDGSETVYREARSEYLLGEVARDDIHDAMVLAAAARHGDLVSLPADPPRDDRGRRMEIVYPDPSSVPPRGET